MTAEGPYRLLATTNPGLEDVTAREAADLVGGDPEREYRGAIGLDGDARAVATLNRWGRTLHRVLVVLADGPVAGLSDVYDLTRGADPAASLDPDRPFAVRSTRHGTHDFGSPDVADRVGQAVVDDVRAATGRRIPVDLDDPAAVLRAFVRDRRFLLAVDATGERSLHRRPYRECEHRAPLRPTIAAAMYRLAEPRPGETLVDPMCGSGTVPCEAALAALGRRPDPDRTYAERALPFLPADPAVSDRDPALEGSADGVGPVRGIDRDPEWVECARTNVAAAGLSEAVRIDAGDAREADLDADLVVSNLPYGVRTGADLPALYAAFSENLRRCGPRRAVLLTTASAADYLGLPVERRVPVRYGRIEAVVVVADP